MFHSLNLSVCVYHSPQTKEMGDVELVLHTICNPSTLEAEWRQDGKLQDSLSYLTAELLYSDH